MLLTLPDPKPLLLFLTPPLVGLHAEEIKETILILPDFRSLSLVMNLKKPLERLVP